MCICVHVCASGLIYDICAHLCVCVCVCASGLIFYSVCFWVCGRHNRVRDSVALLPALKADSLLVTVLMMRTSLKSATPVMELKSAAGRTRRSTPAMVMRGSLGGSTITAAMMSGMEIQVSSPKHL